MTEREEEGVEGNCTPKRDARRRGRIFGQEGTVELQYPISISCQPNTAVQVDCTEIQAESRIWSVEVARYY